MVGRFISSFVDADTGELWEGAEEVESIRRVLNYRQCHITRMPMEDSGAFWDATIYSPRDPKMGGKLSLRLKSDLPVEVYGGYSRQQFAYFFIYEARDKKGRPAFRFSQVPVWLASRIASEEGALEKYAREQATSEQLEFVRIQRSKILKKQLIEIDGDKLIITGAKEVRSGVELAFDQETLSFIKVLESSALLNADYEIEDYQSAYEYICNSGFRLCGKLSKQLNLNKYVVNRAELPPQVYSNLIRGLIRIYNGNDRVIDLSSLGGPSKAGAMVTGFDKLLNDPNTDFFIIDQSVTGMFERRTRVGL